MDLKIYYKKIREAMEAIPGEFAVLVSRETPDGGVKMNGPAWADTGTARTTANTPLVTLSPLPNGGGGQLFPRLSQSTRHVCAFSTMHAYAGGMCHGEARGQKRTANRTMNVLLMSKPPAPCRKSTCRPKTYPASIVLSYQP